MRSTRADQVKKAEGEEGDAAEEDKAWDIFWIKSVRLSGS